MGHQVRERGQNHRWGGQGILVQLSVGALWIHLFRVDEEINYANDEVLFFIDEKTATINIEEMIYQSIELEAPFVMYCPDCEKKHENLPEEETDEIEFEEEQWWNIVFHK